MSSKASSNLGVVSLRIFRSQNSQDGEKGKMPIHLRDKVIDVKRDPFHQHFISLLFMGWCWRGEVIEVGGLGSTSYASTRKMGGVLLSRNLASVVRLNFNSREFVLAQVHGRSQS